MYGRGNKRVLDAYGVVELRTRTLLAQGCKRNELGFFVKANQIECRLSREVTSGAKSRQFRSEWTPLGVHVCLDE
jgi:hypothetical protein